MRIGFAPFVAAWLLFTPAIKADIPAPPHANEPVLRSEHAALLDLVKPQDATCVAAKDGPWSNPATWTGGRIPDANARVLVPGGVSVTFDAEKTPPLHWLRVDGSLVFTIDRKTALLVETIVVSPAGSLTIGTVQKPVPADITAKITFTDPGPIDARHDPMLLSRGLISHGSTTFCGAARAPFSAVSPSHRGDTKLTLATPPSGWRAGDRIVITGTLYGRSSQDEVRRVRSISGNDVLLDEPLAFDHVAPDAQLSPYAANLTRNIILESQNTQDPSRAGHVMFMHSPRVRIENAAFDHLGRTEKLKPIDDPKLDAAGVPIGGAGQNPRGRYAVHFHRTGIDGSKDPARVAGCAVVDCPGWGYVNHSSSVDFEGNVAFNVTGSAFVTEAGDEIGSFRDNIAVRSVGSGEDEDARRKLQDFGHEGDGFWFQGGGVVVEDNVAAGQSASGFIYFTQGLEESGLGKARYAVANLWQPAWQSTTGHVDHKDPKHIDDPNTVPVIRVPIRSFKNNTAFACRTGFTTRFMSPEPARSVLADSAAWNCSYGVRVRYTTNLDLLNLRLINGPEQKTPFGAVFGTLEGEQDILYKNLEVKGWPVGIYVPEAGHHVIDGGSYANARSIYIPTPMQRGRAVEIKGNLHFANPPTAIGDANVYDIYLEAVYAPLLGNYRDPNVLFARDATLFNGEQLYYLEQAPDAVPFPDGKVDGAMAKKRGQIAGNLPAELIGKTNRDLFDTYGIALAGAVAPADAHAAPRIHGLLGSLAAYPTELRPTVVRTTQAKAFALSAYAENKSATLRTDPADLQPGWNLLTAASQGAKHSFLIFAGDSKSSAKPGYSDKAGKAR